MRRRKLVIAVILLITWAATAADDVWNDPPFLKSPYTNDTLVKFNETCTIEEKCALVYLKEGIVGNFEILRLNSNSKPVLLTVQNNIIGLEVAEDNNTPKFFLRSKNPGDFEGSTKQFTALFNVNPPTYTAIIRLENINNNKPIIEAPTECEAVEEEVGATDCVFNVKDADGSACYTKITSSDSHFTFELEGKQENNCMEAKYRLHVVEALDYETYRLHSITIMAHDEGQTGPNTFLEPRIVFDESLSFVVTVGDIPDNAPMWTRMMPSIQVEELKEQTEQFTAIDGDIGLNWTIVYHIDTEFEYFSIEKDSGLLTIEAIDRDKTQVDVYNLVIYATEVPEEPFPNEPPLNISTEIVVVVKDINNNIPAFQELEIDFPIYKDEGLYFSEELFTVIDPDLALNGTFSIEFLKDDYDHYSNFMVVPTTGYQKSTITVTSINASKLDYEDPNWRTITLKFVSKESADPLHEGFANVTIILRDVNDEPPIFDKSQYVVPISENQKAGELILTVHASDRDEGDTIEYFMRSNSVSNILQVNNETGEISTIDKAFDYERQNEIVFQVYAKDTAPIPHQASCEVQINIININDEKPELSLPFEAEELLEHSDSGTNVSDVISATDPDLELADLHFFINWTATQAFKNGILVKSREDYENVLVLADTVMEDFEWKTYLVINDKKRFDWEKFESLRVNIVVNDTATAPGYEHNQMRNGYVTVTVVDVNDCAPVFTVDSDTHVDVVENNTNIRLVGAVRATDDDSAEYADIIYSILPLFPEDLVLNPLQLTVDNKTGQLFTSRIAFDCEEFVEMEYEYRITASDGEHDTHHKIIVKVEDINDNAPTYYEEIPPDILNPKIYEEQEGRHEIVCLDAEDKDRTIPFNVITYFMENEDLFEMVNNCLWAVDGKLLDREDERGELRQLTIYTRDNHENGNKYNSNEGQKVAITLTLLDINDNAPQLPHLDLRVIETEAKPDKFLIAVEVKDPDKGVNGTIECKWMDVVVKFPPGRPDVNDLFELETKDNFCNICLKDDLIWGDYIIHLNVSDKGVPHSKTNATSYDLEIANYNLRRPKIEKPNSGIIYRILRDELSKGDEPLRDYYNETIEDFEVTDDDDPRLPAGKVELKLYGGDNMFRLKDVTKDSNGPAKFRLIKDDSPDPSQRKLEMILQANDRDIDELPSDQVPISIYFIDPASIPEFNISTFETQFTENSTGLDETQNIPEAINQGEQLLQGNKRPVFYYIIEGDERFEFLNNTRTLKLNDELDYEVDTEHKLRVLATHEKEMPENPPTDDTTSILWITVEVIDVNDMPPKFSQSAYYGVFRIYDTSESEPIATVNATDNDTNDEVFYEYIKNTLDASTDSLKELIREDLFKVDKSTGHITRNFSPNGKDLSGFFWFKVVAYDTAGNIEGHRDEAEVKVYVVSEKHQVIFNFLNDVEEVQKQREEICPALSRILTFSCSVEKVLKAKEESEAKGANTDVYTHFINDNEKSPVEASDIASKVLEGDTYRELSRAMTELHLTLVSFTSPSSPEEDSMAMTIVLAAVCAVLAVLVIVFSLAFVVRTRTLNQRLEKLTMKKFGSQDSGLNRETLAVPGTNRHALEGSNPVWNHEIDPNFDAQSDVSGDSDLIGIEDSPEFGGTGKTNPAFERDVIPTNDHPSSYEQSAVRRTSINPLAAQAEAANDPYGFSEPLGGDMDVPRRFSINPLAAGGNDLNFDVSDEEPNAEDVDNVYFNTLHSHTSEPTTEL